MAIFVFCFNKNNIQTVSHIRWTDCLRKCMPCHTYMTEYKVANETHAHPHNAFSIRYVCSVYAISTSIHSCFFMFSSSLKSSHHHWVTYCQRSYLFSDTIEFSLVVNLHGFFYTHKNKQTNKRTNIRVINICVCFSNQRRYTIFFASLSLSKIESMRTRNRHGNEEFVTETKRCLNVSKHHFSMCSLLIKHTERGSERKGGGGRGGVRFVSLCFCYFLHALSFFFIFISFVLSFCFAKFPFLRPPTHLPPFCVSFQTISNVCLRMFFYPILVSIYLDYWSFSLFLSIFFSFCGIQTHKPTNSHTHILPHNQTIYNQ